MKKPLHLFLCLLTISLLSPALAVNSEHIIYGLPGTRETILYRKGYVLAHDNKKKVASWVSYHLTDAYLVQAVPRSNDFRPDLDLPKGQRSELVDYRRSGYDRGHLCPAEDMRRERQTESETFLLSNMAPQVGVGFNRGLWMRLESKVRQWAKKRHNIYVITGPIYAEKDYRTIGPDKVAVPTRFYKIIVARAGSSIDAIAFIMPNKNLGATPIKNYISTIDEVEKETGLDFLRELTAEVQAKLEARKAEMW
jgi:endonuclease G, mitochondrial